MLDRGWHSGPVFGTHSGGHGRGQAAGPVPRAAGGRARAGRHAVGGPDGRPVRGDEQADASRLRGAQRVLRRRVSRPPATPASSGSSNANTAASSACSARATTPTPPLLTGQLGERWETSTIMVKSYAAMGGLHGAIDAARRLRQALVPEAHLARRHHRRRDGLQARLVDARAPAHPHRRADEHRLRRRRPRCSTATCCPSSSPARGSTPTTSGALIDAHRRPPRRGAATPRPSPSASAPTSPSPLTDGDRPPRPGRAAARRAQPIPMTNDELVAKFHALADRVTTRDRASGDRAGRDSGSTTSTTSPS